MIQAIKETEATQKTDRRITLLQYINTILLGLLTLAVTVGSVQLSILNEKYTDTAIKQGKLEERVSYILSNQVNVIKRLGEVEKEVQNHKYKFEQIEANLPEKKNKKKN